MVAQAQGFAMAHVRKSVLALFALLAVLLAVGGAVPVRAAERVSSLPFVNNFATARFKLLGTTEIENQTIKTFGEGAVVLPDRTSAWVGTDSSDTLSYVIQIGSTVYQRIGSGEWQQDDGAAVNALPVSAQFNLLQEYANAILFIGDAQVGNVATKHYQVWLSGQKALELAGIADDIPAELRDFYAETVYKYDFWIGQGDNFVYQQNIEFTTPAGEFDGEDLPQIRSATLTTFYDINNPNISINAP